MRGRSRDKNLSSLSALSRVVLSEACSRAATAKTLAALFLRGSVRADKRLADTPLVRVITKVLATCAAVSVCLST